MRITSPSLTSSLSSRLVAPVDDATFTGASTAVLEGGPCSSGGLAYVLLISSGGFSAIESTVAFSTLRGLEAVVFATGACDPSSFFST